MENHNFSWENPLFQFQWPFSIAMLVHQRVITRGVFHLSPELSFRISSFQFSGEPWSILAQDAAKVETKKEGAAARSVKVPGYMSLGLQMGLSENVVYP